MQIFSEAGGGGTEVDRIRAYELIEKMVDEELAAMAENYQEGLFISTGGEKFRMERIREICTGAALAMAEQLSAESVTGAEFEENFGRRGSFDPVRLKVGDDEVYVEGKIDRADFIDVDGQRRVRIIDYKTGSDKLDLGKMRQGYKMQLMIYLISASSGDLEPAGMFYFNIKDPIETANDKSAAILQKIEDREPEDEFKLRGTFINEEGVLNAMPVSVLASDKGIDREEYESVRNDVLARIEETAAGILSGRIGINPLKNDNKLVCSYCSYKSVCRRDRGYVKNSARSLKTRPDSTADDNKEPKAKDNGD
jgi:ATP-dependent helicase/nuclease subunit B